MVLLYSLTLTCLVGLAKNAELFSENCCSKKNVGGVDYTQIPGDTAGFDNCKADCVYERDDTPGSRYCFSTGNANTDKPAMCTESTSTTQEINVFRTDGLLVFPTSMESIICNTSAVPPSSQDEFQKITCSTTDNSIISSLEVSAEPPGDETATLITSSPSSGNFEWLSLHTENEWIHCTFNSGMNCSICTTCKGGFNTLYVEGTTNDKINQSAGLHVQLDECNKTCVMNSSCSFWTFSYLQDTGHQHRNHDNKSECGLRSYDACCLIETNRDQWFGFVRTLSGQPPAPTPQPNPRRNTVAVWKKMVNKSDFECFNWCLNTQGSQGCKTWTWETEKNACVLNNYTPTRNIPIGYVNNPTPSLYSGCIDRGSFKCAGVPTVGGYQA